MIWGMQDQTQVSANEPSLLAGGIFVVQLRSDSDVERQCLRGRVEHVVSGGNQRFESIAELLGFMGRYAATPGGDGALYVAGVTQEVDPHAY